LLLLLAPRQQQTACVLRFLVAGMRQQGQGGQQVFYDTNLLIYAVSTDFPIFTLAFSRFNLTKMREHNYFVYILTNKGRTVLYIGVTNNLKTRLKQHAGETNPNAFSARYHCHYLIYYEYFNDILMAIAREKELKKWNRSKKEALIARKNPEWRFLNDDV
jgi:putative endonuclease